MEATTARTRQERAPGAPTPSEVEDEIIAAAADLYANHYLETGEARCADFEWFVHNRILDLLAGFGIDVGEWR